MGNFSHFFQALLLALVCLAGIAHAVSFEEDVRLSQAERDVLVKFKRKVLPILPQKFMKTDFYLVRWLRARNFDIGMAEQMLKNNLKWRRVHRIDQIENEDWSDLKVEYPYSTDKVDKWQRPVGAVNLGAWNFRKIALAGNMPRLQRYMTKILEEGMTLVHQQQAKGYNVTQFKIILNLEGFNQIQHACPICLPAYTYFVSTYEERYPGYCDQAIHINTPAVYDIVLNLIRPLFSPQTRQAVKILGTDKEQWMRYLDKEIARDQRRVEFGGTLRD